MRLVLFSFQITLAYCNSNNLHQPQRLPRNMSGELKLTADIAGKRCPQHVKRTETEGTHCEDITTSRLLVWWTKVVGKVVVIGFRVLLWHCGAVWCAG